MLCSYGTRREHQNVQFESSLYLRILILIWNTLDGTFVLWNKSNKYCQISWVGEFFENLKLAQKFKIRTFITDTTEYNFSIQISITDTKESKFIIWISITDTIQFFISNSRGVLNVVCFFLGNSPASEFYMPTFRNTMSVPSSSMFGSKITWATRSGYFRAKLFLYKYSNFSQIQSHFIPTRLWRWNRQSVPKRRHIKFRRRGITQKKAFSHII